MKNFLRIILCALSVPCIATPGSSSPVHFAHTLTVNVKKISKLPDGQEHIRFPADDFLDFYHTKQSPQAVLCCKNELLKILFTQVQSQIASLRADKITRKSQIFSATITLPELPFTFCVKYTLRKQESEIHIVLSAFVPTATDAKILSVVTNFCNAQVPVLSFFQKNKKKLLTLASVMGAAVVGFFVKKEIKRREAIKQKKLEKDGAKKRAEEELEQNKAILIAFKKYLTTTPFLHFASEYAEVPNTRARITPHSLQIFIPHYSNCSIKIGSEIITNNPLLDLTDAQRSELVTGCFKESTIDLLANFQEKYMIALQQDGKNDTITAAKESAFGEFIQNFIELIKSDPVEATRILCMKPHLIWEKLRLSNFFSTRVWKEIQTFCDNDIIKTKISPGVDAKYFAQTLQMVIDRTCCMKDSFPQEIALFQNLHKVQLSAQK
ncbi:hypothetical protein FJ366_04005 [Candidatus Dependentiae bacterium]|nr:hypothetical protein [Candidatus Dependentiae bacterium]